MHIWFSHFPLTFPPKTGEGFSGPSWNFLCKTSCHFQLDEAGGQGCVLGQALRESALEGLRPPIFDVTPDWHIAGGMEMAGVTLCGPRRFSLGGSWEGQRGLVLSRGRETQPDIPHSDVLRQRTPGHHFPVDISYFSDSLHRWHLYFCVAFSGTICFSLWGCRGWASEIGRASCRERV